MVGRHSRPRLRLEVVETQLLLGLLDELDALLDDPAPDGALRPQAVDDPDAEVRARLFPAAYPDDESAAAEFRSLTETSLRAERIDRIGSCRADLAAGGDVDLAAADTVRRWLQVLNDLRLALGTRLAITEEDDHRLDPADPDHHDRLVYHWLTAVQDTVVQAVMG